MARDAKPSRTVTTTAPPQPPAAEDPSALEARRKAQARRVQVRRAQVQHRKRKADYTKQLETEVADYRNMIADVGVECALLKGENDAARALLAAAAASCVLPPPSRQHHYQGVPPSSGGGGGNGQPVVSYFDDIDIDGLVISLVMDEAMGAQTWQVSQVPAPSAAAAAAAAAAAPAVSTLVPPPPPPTSSPLNEQGPDSNNNNNNGEMDSDVPGGSMPLSLAQTQQAINLILAMEHCCRDHFHLADLDPDLDLAHETGGEPATGHHMMATALALRDAPSSIAAGPTARGSEIISSISSSSSSSSSSSWRASGLTLAALRGLAQSLAPLAGPELTPVQAWFELVDRFPAELLLRRDVADGLKREFVGVVRCVHFGAAVERDAFESVVSRVLGAEYVGR